MRVVRIATVFGVLSMVAPPGASASDTNGDFAVRGVGAQTYATLTQQLQADPQTMPLITASWLMGYLTALNRNQDGTYDMSPVADPGAMTQMIVGLCAQNPDQLVESVTDSVVRILAPHRVATSSPLVETAADGQTASVRQDVLMRMQVKLQELGYNPGATDGAFGPQTSEALRGFQTAQSLTVTGIADAATILRLLVETPAAAP